DANTFSSGDTLKIALSFFFMRSKISPRARKRGIGQQRAQGVCNGSAVTAASLMLLRDEHMGDIG
ncbi:hypothetical protein, partial [Herminiimonas sp. CN]|uniref:hypothetical protein n=1 Tax=Herminiimonas sp. CN TaxID=1349818 RepID=UPI001EE663B8